MDESIPYKIFVHKCEYFVVLNYDEMNYTFFFQVFFKIYSKVQILVICNNHEFDVLMNGNVKFVET
jgi:hypothetical protein